MQYHKDFPKMPLVGYQEIFERFTEKQFLVTTTLTKNHVKCDYCGKELIGKRRKQHINICQTTMIHTFCSKDCKNMWCFDTQKGRYNLKVNSISSF